MNSNLINDKFTGVFIPREIWFLKDLSRVEKEYLSVIRQLSIKQHCTAGNAYFAELFQTSKDSSSRMIKKIIKHGYIKRTFEYKTGTKEVEKRILILTNKVQLKGIDFYSTPIEQNNYPVSNKLTLCIEQDVEDIVKSNNKEEDNKVKESKKKNFKSFMFDGLKEKEFYSDKLLDTLVEWQVEVRKKKGGVNNPRAFQRIVNDVVKFSNGNINSAIDIIGTSIEEGWKKLVDPNENKNNYYNKSGNKATEPQTEDYKVFKVWINLRFETRQLEMLNEINEQQYTKLITGEYNPKIRKTYKYGEGKKNANFNIIIRSVRSSFENGTESATGKKYLSRVIERINIDVPN